MQHTDRVSMACQAQLANVIAPISTRPGGPAWRQAIFHPFALTSRYAAGTVLRPAVVSDVVETAAYGAVDQLLATATLDPETGDLVVFAVNRSRTEECELTIDLDALTHSATGARNPGGEGERAAYASGRQVEHLTLHDTDPNAHNTEAEPERVTPRAGDAVLDGSTLRAVLPPISWHCIRLTEGNNP